ncbi:MAG: TA system VapC family ribonuclease toxin [Lysobacterales bacterium]
MSSATLLDGNVLVALTDQAHVHHVQASAWFAAHELAFATCPITQGTLLRMLLRHQAVASAPAALAVLNGLMAHARHRFWPDDLGYAEVSWHGVLGHRQVTDAYLAALARHHHGRLATLDRGLAALHADVAEWIPV